MIVRLEAAGALVAEAEDCGRLHLETGLAGSALRTALRTTGTGTLDDDGGVWLDLAVLRSRAQLAAPSPGLPPDWAQRWEAMVSYAGRQGWLSPDGHAVRVHVERRQR